MNTGYGMILNSVLYHKDLTDKQKILFCCISSLCAKEGFCWATNKYFSNKLGVTENTISVNISRLRELGFICVEIENNYKRKIVLPTLWIYQQGGIEKSTGGGIEKSTHNNTIDNNIKDNTLVHQKDAHVIQFCFFWNAYPLKKSKKKAESIYRSLLDKSKNPEELHKSIMDGLDKYNKEIQYKTKKMSMENKKFDTHRIKHPTTWLNQGCREDEYEYENKQIIVKKSQTIPIQSTPHKELSSEEATKVSEMLQKTRQVILSKSK